MKLRKLDNIVKIYILVFYMKNMLFEMQNSKDC